MLINCPECGKRISNQSEQCIHCGYPLKNDLGIQVSTEKCPICNGKEHILIGTEDTCSICGYVFNAEQCKQINPNWKYKNKIFETKPKNILTCPRCGSTSISTINGEIYHDLFGGFKSDPVNVCQSCGYKFKPGSKF